jgi:hypothetical protein
MSLEFSTKDKVWCVMFQDTNLVLCYSTSKAICVAYIERMGGNVL